ncbi:uncharacterized protein M6B38_190935 [Iris pallida]|uniref:Uncharacterized protein n=1 Tax=Iris pallida TaxID=29817 RepID=A0AAX6EFD0_IRIPA|nr:uncharacterized protein M6B38_190935 [Iris pallida]
MIDRYKHQQLQIGPMYPHQIRAWANKILPKGEIVGDVTKPPILFIIKPINRKKMDCFVKESLEP